MVKQDKRTNNDLLSRNVLIEQQQTPLKAGGDLRFSRRI